MIQFIKKRYKRRNRDSFIKKKLNKKIRQRPRSDVMFRVSNNIKKKILLISVISVGIALLVVWIIWRNSFFYGSTQTITQVEFSSWSIERYSNQQLIQTITNDLTWTSRRANNRFGLTSTIQQWSEQFGIVDDVLLESFDQWKVTIDIIWKTPSLLFRLPWNRRYWSYNQEVFTIDPQDWITSSTWIVDLPRYTETFDNIDGIFWSYSESELVDVLRTIDTIVWSENISEYIYLPGGKKLFVWYDSKRRYIHLNKDIPNQLDKLVAVRDYYQDYENISIIDLWSTDNVIVQ